MNQLSFGKNRREGIARVFDNLLTASILSLVISLAGHSELTLYEHLLLIGASLLLVISSYVIILVSPKGFKNATIKKPI